METKGRITWMKGIKKWVASAPHPSGLIVMGAGNNPEEALADMYKVGDRLVEPSPEIRKEHNKPNREE